MAEQRLGGAKERTRDLTIPSLAPLTMRIYLLGPLRIELAGQAIRLPRRKVESLLAYLLLHPEPHSRDQLATLFWGDSADAQARQSLRTALATLRKTIDPALLITEQDQVQINPAFPRWVDLQTLLALEGELAQATGEWLLSQLELWQGELLIGHYDEWLTLAREVYHARLLNLALQIVQTLRARSDYERAIAVAQQILTFDPTHEAAHQHLIFCYVAAGDRDAALRQYELCERILLEELDVPPLAETTALYEWIRQQAGPAVSTAARITNLPIPLTSFVGRTHETAAVKQLLTAPRGKTRALTLIGAGGSGKTRLAIQAATDLIDSFAHGVWWVELAALVEGGAVMRAIANSVGVRESAGQSLEQSVLNFLLDKQILLVLDNCEHLIEACAAVGARLLSQCPQVQILATSREPLNIAGETLWLVPTFATPDPQTIAQTDSFLRFESLQLFAERATSVQAGFTLTADNAQTVAEICQRLDGIPLAIELAAARIKVLSAEQIADHIKSDRFALLTQGQRTASPRQQTLLATIDWSYNLLSEGEREFFRQVAVFQGGFGLEALQHVICLEADGHSYGQPLDLLTQLVDKSLIIVETHGGQNRYRLLETLREYALEQFVSVVTLQAVQQRHAAYFLHLAEQADTELGGPHQQSWLFQIDAEYPNLRNALAFANHSADRELSMRFSFALWKYWDTRGYFSEARRWLANALAQRGEAAPKIQANALTAAGFFAIRQDDYGQARLFLEESVSILLRINEPLALADTLLHLSDVDMRTGHYAAAHERMVQSLAGYRSLNRPGGVARALGHLGNWAWDQGQQQAAHDYYLESLQIFRQLGNQVSIATGLFNLGNVLRIMGDFAAAKLHYEECIAIARATNNPGLLGVTLRNLGIIAYHQQAYDAAYRHCEEGLRILLEIGEKSNAGFGMINLGRVVQAMGEKRRALDYFRQSLTLMHELGHARGTSFALETIASLLIDERQQLAFAARVLGATETLRQTANLSQPISGPDAYERSLTELRNQLSTAELEEALNEGRTTRLAQIISEALALTMSS